LYLAQTLEETARQFEKAEGEILHILNQARAKLAQVRAQRPRPHLDDKIITSWNGLMISALSRAGQALGDRTYVVAAQRAAQFLMDQVYDRETRQTYRRWRDDEKKGKGVADDYSVLAQGLLDLYR